LETLRGFFIFNKNNRRLNLWGKTQDAQANLKAIIWKIVSAYIAEIIKEKSVVANSATAVVKMKNSEQ